MTDTGFWGRQRLLVLAPHADDETFGCGGLMAKVKAAGGSVYVIVATVGDLRHYGANGAHARAGAREQEQPVALAASAAGATAVSGMTLVSAQTRTDELAAAMATIGVDGWEILFKDTHLHLRLDSMPQRDLIALIERDARHSIDSVAPTVLVLPPRTYNQDHEALFKAGFTACRAHLPEDRPFVPLVLACDSPQMGWSYRTFRPNFYVDISAYLETKLRAHACHRSQLKPAPHHASLENVERLARLRGAEISLEAAEAFECYRMVM